MTMSKISIDHCMRNFTEQINSIETFVLAAKTLYYKTLSSTYAPIHPRTYETLVGLQLLKTTLVWEDFLESVFLRYMCGCASPNGYRPVLIQARRKSIYDAMNMLLGSRGRFLSWSTVETQVRARANFDIGDPFVSSFASSITDLDSISTIRNRFAHCSDYAKQKFRSVVRNELGYVPLVGMTPGRFLLTERKMGKRKKQTYFEYYMNVLRSVASTIAP